MKLLVSLIALFVLSMAFIGSALAAKKVDKASPALMRAATGGAHIKRTGPATGKRQVAPSQTKVIVQP